jgi:hypothetical protein
LQRRLGRSIPAQGVGDVLADVGQAVDAHGVGDERRRRAEREGGEGERVRRGEGS